jgi:hypothetical protein
MKWCLLLKKARKFLAGSVMLFCMVLLQACAGGKSLRTAPVKNGDLQGTYALILYGGNYADDLETIAVLDREGDRYTFEPFASSFSYRIIRGQTAEQAIPAAEQFIRRHPSYNRAQMQAILDEQEYVIGYEIRPLYLPLDFGTDDVLDVDYNLRGEKVIATIRLTRSVEELRNDRIHRHR